MKIKLALAIALFLTAAACKKSVSPTKNTTPAYPVITDSAYAPVDPSLPATIGFFGGSWAPRTFSAPADSPVTNTTTLPPTDSLTIDVNHVLVKTPPLVFGNNSNLWIGQLVTQPNLMQYLKDLSPNIIRAPAGSVSDVYFFDGVDTAQRPADAPDSVITSGTLGPIGSWYGGNTQSYTLSLANYYSVLAQTHSTGVITINYGYARYGTGPNPVAAAAHLAADWVRHDNGRTKYWEIGNETYGSWEAGYQIDTNKNKDHQPMIQTGALYGQHLKVFADSMRAAAQQTGATIYIGATLYNSPAASNASTTIQTWNQGVLTNAGATADFFIIHDYFTGYQTNSTVPQILSTGTSESWTDMNYIKQQLQSNNVSAKPIAMTEWNIQATGSKQNTSFVAGMHAALTLGSFIKNQYGEASRWDIANGYASGDDQGMFNLGDETGAPLWNPRPAFYYMYYFQKFFGDRMVFDTLRRINPDIITYSSTFNSGQAGTIIVNSGIYNHVVSVDFQHFPAGSKYHWYILTGGTDNAPFSSQVYVNGTGPTSPTGGPLNYASIKPYGGTLSGSIKLFVPPMSVIYLMADSK